VRRLGLAAAIALPFLIYLAAWPVPGEPVAWSPPASPGYTGPYAANRALAAAERLDVGGEGPEDVAVGRDGAVFTGLRDGRIVRLDPETLRAATFAETGGRPLGLRFAPDGRLLIADAERGLLAASPDGSVTVLASDHAGRPLRLTDDLDVARDGTVYFSVASERFAVDDSVADVVEHRTTGRLFAYDAATRSTRLLLEGLCFANGVALAPDESYVLVVETACYRVRRFWLRGERAGASEVVVDGLPGFPDGILGDGEGTFWLTLVSPRNALLDALHPHPALKKALSRLPAAIRPGPKAYGMVVALSGDGRVLGTLQDPDGQDVAFVTNAVPSGPWLYLGMLKGHAVARVPRPARYSSPMTPKSMEPASR
jgi:sugar lactone lactonase YvrE